MVAFAIAADPRLKTKEKEKIIRYFDLARELKKFWNMKVTVIPTETISKGHEKRLDELEIRGRIETIQTKAL